VEAAEPQVEAARGVSALPAHTGNRPALLSGGGEGPGRVGEVCRAEFEMFVINVDGTGQTQLTGAAGINLSPNWGVLEIPGRVPAQEKPEP
jgi:hypothetical protein